MNINLSKDIIYKIACVSFGRIQDLKEKEEETRNSIKELENQIVIKQNTLKEVEKFKREAKEVYELFFKLIRDLEWDGYKDD